MELTSFQIFQFNVNRREREEKYKKHILIWFIEILLDHNNLPLFSFVTTEKKKN